MNRRAIVLAAMGLVMSFSALAADIPLNNWTVPSYRTSSASGGLTTMTDVTPGVGFVGVAPCRLIDTRQAGFPAGYGPPSLTQGVPRNFDLNSDPQCPGIPAGVDAYSLNVTVTNTQGPGFILIYPQGGSQPTVSTVNYVAGQTIANAAIVPAGTNGGVTVVAGVSGTNLVIDINGYFTDQYNPGVSFHALSTSAGDAIFAENTYGVFGGNAVHGKSLNGYGVFGESVTNNGVAASSAAAGNAAVWAVNTSSGDNSSGVFGWTSATSGNTFGVFGRSDSGSGSGVYGQSTASGYGVYGLTTQGLAQSSGVLGVGRGGRVSPGSGFPTAPGVRGEAYSGIGVLGLTVQTGTADEKDGVKGVVVDNFGAALAVGILGTTSGTTNYGVYSSGDAHVQGTFTAAANKGFVQPHPFDASKEIRYISLEGPHTEVYFRGTAQISQGVTRIPIPQHFRFVADPQTYSTLVTPLGGMATVAVISEGPEGIVVQASRDVKVHYVVYAEREAVRNPDPIIENVHFRPDPDRDFLAHLPDTFRQLMIQNGTLNSDGTVNMETARRLGWDQEWEKRKRPAPQPASD
jgi:hypothetical protein